MNKSVEQSKQLLQSQLQDLYDLVEKLEKAAEENREKAYAAGFQTGWERGFQVGFDQAVEKMVTNRK